MPVRMLNDIAFYLIADVLAYCSMKIVPKLFNSGDNQEEGETEQPNQDRGNDVTVSLRMNDLPNNTQSAVQNKWNSDIDISPKARYNMDRISQKKFTRKLCAVRKNSTNFLNLRASVSRTKSAPCTYYLRPSVEKKERRNHANRPTVKRLKRFNPSLKSRNKDWGLTLNCKQCKSRYFSSDISNDLVFSQNNCVSEKTNPKMNDPNHLNYLCDKKNHCNYSNQSDSYTSLNSSSLELSVNTLCQKIFAKKVPKKAVYRRFKGCECGLLERKPMDKITKKHIKNKKHHVDKSALKAKINSLKDLKKTSYYTFVDSSEVSMTRKKNTKSSKIFLKVQGGGLVEISSTKPDITIAGKQNETLNLPDKHSQKSNVFKKMQCPERSLKTLGKVHSEPVLHSERLYSSSVWQFLHERQKAPCATQCSFGKRFLANTLPINKKPNQSCTKAVNSHHQNSGQCSAAKKSVASSDISIKFDSYQQLPTRTSTENDCLSTCTSALKELKTLMQRTSLEQTHCLTKKNDVSNKFDFPKPSTPKLDSGSSFIREILTSKRKVPSNENFIAFDGIKPKIKIRKCEQAGQTLPIRNSEHDSNIDHFEQRAAGECMDSQITSSGAWYQINRREHSNAENEAMQAWQAFKNSHGCSTINDGNDLKGLKKIAPVWNSLSEHRLSQSPFQNFFDFYKKYCQTNGLNSSDANLLNIEASRVWETLDHKDRLPFIIEAFIYASMGDVNMDSEQNIPDSIRQLGRKDF